MVASRVADTPRMTGHAMPVNLQFAHRLRKWRNSRLEDFTAKDMQELDENSLQKLQTALSTVIKMVESAHAAAAMAGPDGAAA
jgi:hypothetical protein